MSLIIEIPEHLEAKFKSRVKQVYGTIEMTQALQKVIGFWLTKTERDLVVSERKLNNEAFSRLRSELEEKYQGKYAVIAYGKLQGVGESVDSVQNLAAEAHHRLVFKVGESLPRRRDLGWRIQRRRWKLPAGGVKTSSP